MEVPAIRYASTPHGAVAWQAYGPEDAPPVVFVPPLAQHIEMMWQKPVFWRPMLRLATRQRVVQFDKLGTGLSDPVEAVQTLDDRVAQVEAVMDAAGLDRASILGMSEGGLTAVAMATARPERVSALVLFSTLAGASDLAGVGAFGDLPDAAHVLDFWSRFAQRWGTPDTLTLTDFAPSLMVDEAMVRWVPSYERAAASPLLIGRWIEEALRLDVVDRLESVAAPTLVIHLAGDRVVPVAHGRYLAHRIPGARYVEFPGDDHFSWVSPDVDDHIDALHGFLAEHGLAAQPTERAHRIGRRWDPYAALTPAERRCARLAQRGLSNAEIATALDLSVRTVENHLSKTFAKLGVRSRVELAIVGESSLPA